MALEPGAWMVTSAPPLTGCVNLGALLNLSVLKCFHLYAVMKLHLVKTSKDLRTVLGHSKS